MRFRLCSLPRDVLPPEGISDEKKTSSGAGPRRKRASENAGWHERPSPLYPRTPWAPFGVFGFSMPLSSAVPIISCPCAVGMGASAALLPMMP